MENTLSSTKHSTDTEQLVPTRARPRPPEAPTHTPTCVNPEDIAPSDKRRATALAPGTQRRQSHRQEVSRGHRAEGGAVGRSVRGTDFQFLEVKELCGGQW